MANIPTSYEEGRPPISTSCSNSLTMKTHYKLITECHTNKNERE